MYPKNIASASSVAELILIMNRIAIWSIHVSEAKLNWINVNPVGSNFYKTFSPIFYKWFVSIMSKFLVKAILSGWRQDGCPWLVAAGQTSTRHNASVDTVTGSFLGCTWPQPYPLPADSWNLLAFGHFAPLSHSVVCSWNQLH